MAKLWRRSATGEKGTNGLVEIDPAGLHITRPTVIFLSGFFTQDETPHHVRTAMRNIKSLLPAVDPAPDVMVYSHKNLKDIFNVAAYSIEPEARFCKAVKKLSSGVIMPLVAKDFKLNDDGTVTGTPLPLDEAKKNLRNITFFGYSAGTITAQECFNASLKMMKDIGYKEDDARQALAEVVNIGVGVMSQPKKEKNRFTTLSLEATNDKLVLFKNRLWEPLRALFNNFAHKLKIQPLSETSAIITAAVNKKDWETRQKDGKTVKERVKSLLPKWMMVKSFHELPRYVTQDEQLSPFAKIVNYSLANAVTRKERVAPLDLMQPPANTEEKTAAAYRDKIAKAWIKPPKKA